MEETFSLLGETGLEVRGNITRPKPRGTFPLAVLAGDLFDTTQSPFFKELAKQLLEAGFAVTAFDFTNSLGTSDGRVADVTLSQRARDLELVTQHAQGRPGINGKKTVIIAVGFGGTAALALEGFKPVARALTLVNAPMQVEDTAWTRFPEREMQRVRLKRYFHVHRQEKEERINSMFFEDATRIDLARCARNLVTPTLIITGGKASVTPPTHAAWLEEHAIAATRERVTVADLADAHDRREARLVLEPTLAFCKRHKLL